MNPDASLLSKPTISVAIPIYNESENLPELRRRLVATLETLGQDWEVIFVNDGSRDNSAEMLRQYHAEEPRLRVVYFSRNFGHQPAITAGVHLSRGQCVILMDGDLQDPPELIPQLVAAWREGAQVVLAERSGRPERGARGLGFKMFYPLMRRMTDLPAPDAGVFGLMDRKVVDQFNKLPERNRFIPGLRSWLGFKQARVPYERQSRAAGAPKQSLAKLIKYAMDGMISFSYKPLRWVTYAGFMASGFAFVMAVYYFITFFVEKKEYTGFTTIILSVLFLGGIQLISVGILGEYIGRIYEEIKQRPLYVIDAALGFEEGSERQEAKDAARSLAPVLGGEGRGEGAV